MNKILKNTSACIAVAVIAASNIVMADPHTDALEKRLKIMEKQMGMMQDELALVREEARQPSAKAIELEEWVAKVKKIEPYEKKNMVFFRGGFARNDTDRTGDILTDANTDGSGSSALPANFGGLNTRDFTGNPSNGNNNGWYFGAGIEHSITEDLFGLWDDTEMFGEILFEYKEFDSHTLNRAPLPTAANDSVNAAANAHGLTADQSIPVCASNLLEPKGNSGLIANNGGPYGSCINSVTVTQFTLTASPKIKFMKGGDFRPWIIPAGLTINVVSPPSDGATYIAPGIMFAGGAEYHLWNNIYIGADARYNLTSNAMDGVDIDGFTAGGYLGFGF